MEDYNNENNFYQIPPKPNFHVDNTVYDNYDYNNLIGMDMNSTLSRPATPTSPLGTPTRISSPIPPRVASPIPPRISSPIPQRISSPIPPRVASPIQPRVSSPIPQRIASPIPRISSPIQRINSPSTRDLNSPLNSNFDFETHNLEVNYNNDYNINYIDNYNNNIAEMKSLRNSSSFTSLKLEKVNSIKNLRNSNSVNSLSSLRNQQQQQLVTKKPLEIIGTPQDQLQKLIFQAKVITNQLQTLSSQDTKLEIYSEGKLPSYENLVKTVSEKFQVQREINQASARLLTINYIVNITNFCRTHQLHQNILEGQKKISELESTIHMLENFIEDINVENEMNKQTAERLKSSLDDTRTILENAIQEYRKEINDHRKILRKQNNYIDAIHNSKINQDLLVDASIFCIAMYVVNLPLIDFPLHSIFQTLMKPGRRRAFTKQLAKLIMIYLLVRKMRKFAIQYGLHNKIGSFSPYFYKLINFLIPTSYQNEIKDMTFFLLQSNTNNKNNVKKPEEIKKIESLEDMKSNIDIITQ
ncbi:hypothetical protein BCR36DRAFT_409223 [Piromyces finnis]|uniref:Uncharacterized protein n=1 Tax=Piromyces finnis TaxID=1754191 RepID=A0A1Y1VKW2_9FUNG|nr:hypothetical protein BCR36DRAFT_409223 [Piromyces finnis]|eukprot:ORX57746.1 hypothetical protein BCR36DRAFT_409223 [Piromyces finnis]